MKEPKFKAGDRVVFAGGDSLDWIVTRTRFSTLLGVLICDLHRKDGRSATGAEADLRLYESGMPAPNTVEISVDGKTMTPVTLADQLNAGAIMVDVDLMLPLRNGSDFDLRARILAGDAERLRQVLEEMKGPRNGIS
jgi:hypothetical protein